MIAEVIRYDNDSQSSSPNRSLAEFPAKYRKPFDFSSEKFHVCFCGDAGVGKTELIQSIVQFALNSDSNQLNIQELGKTVDIEAHEVPNSNLIFFDTPGIDLYDIYENFTNWCLDYCRN